MRVVKCWICRFPLTVVNGVYLCAFCDMRPDLA